MNAPSFKLMPSQKVPDSKKMDEDWKQLCVDAAESMVLLQNQYTRLSRYNKQVNYDLYGGILHQSDVEKMMNPTGIKNIQLPAKPRNFPITNPYIKSLVGESIKRRFDYHLKVNNEDAISNKEKDKNEEVNTRLDEILRQGLSEDISEEELNKKLDNLHKYQNYEWQDKRELAGTRLLNYYEDYLDTKAIFVKGFEDGLLVAEEIYDIDVVANEPTFRKCNPLNTYFLLAPDSWKIEESDIIVEELYIPLSKVIDTYYEYLKPEDIDYLELRTGFKSNAGYGGAVNYELQDPVFAIPLGGNTGIDINTLNTGANSFSPFDNQNNIRVVKVRWRSLRKIGILTYFDENGKQQEKPVHEKWPVDKFKGESIKYTWIGEWWEGTKIANSIYVKIQPRPIQFRKLNNLSECASGYVGSVYKTNSSLPQSLFDLMKSYQYQFNLLMYRMELAVMRNKGKIPEFDFAKVPDGWTVDKWMYYFEMLGFAVTDSFKEAKKGVATGKLAGNLAGHSNTMDLEQGQHIQSFVTLLQYTESQLDKITGISPQRRGQITSSDPGLGVTQESRQASATITEWYFKIHDDTKIRVAKTLLETAKYCLRNGDKKIPYIADELSSAVYTVDGAMINEAEFDLLLRDTTQDAESINALRKAVDAGFQTGALDLIQFMDVYSNKSFASMQKKVEASVIQKEEQRQKEVEAQNQTAQLAIQQKEQEALRKEELIKYKIDEDNRTKIAIAEIGVFNKQEDLDQNDDDILDPMAIAEQTLKENEHQSNILLENQKLEHEKSKTIYDKQKHDKEIAIKEKEIKSKEKIAAENNAAKIKVAVKNKNRFDKPKK